MNIFYLRIKNTQILSSTTVDKCICTRATRFRHLAWSPHPLLSAPLPPLRTKLSFFGPLVFLCSGSDSQSDSILFFPIAVSHLINFRLQFQLFSSEPNMISISLFFRQCAVDGNVPFLFLFFWREWTAKGIGVMR